MIAPRYRAWQFAQPDAGLAIANSGGVAMVDGDASIRQAILLLISTRPGERVMRPSYGCELHRLMFLPNDETTAGLAIHYVRRALARWEPRIDVLDVDAGSSAEAPDRLEIRLEYRVRATARTDALAVAISLSGDSV